LTRVRIALIRQCTVTINGLVAAPLQFGADRRFTGAGNAVNQIISPAHGSLLPFSSSPRHALVMHASIPESDAAVFADFLRTA
jgi:hypothetical protein